MGRRGPDAAAHRADPAVSSDAITDLDAHALSRAIHAREVSCVEVMRAYLARIHRLNPRLNAIVNLAPDDALLAQARERDDELARGASRGFLHGVPQAIKDAANAVGFPTTFGCALLKDQVARVDGLMVQRMKAAGCIVIGKTNMPEFGLGSHTYNNLFGTTANAWDPAVSAGGSSGGAAVCLAQRLLPLADGSDFMGSLRNPAGWNHVFGLRPSQGRVPSWPAADVWVAQLGTEGPMARNVRDLAALLSIQAGYDARTPLSIAQRPQAFSVASGPQAFSVAHGPHDFAPREPLSLRGARIAWLGDLGGHLALEAGIAEVCEQALQRMADAGAVVEPLNSLGIDLDRVWHAWLVGRRLLTAPRVAAALALAGAAREQIKPEALWEHDQAQSLQGTEFMRAAEMRTRLYAQMLALLQRFDALALPVAQVWPFAIEQHWPRQIAGRTMDTYHRWMEVTLYATFAGLPAISVPAGFDAAGRLPMGLQLIGRPQGDAALLQLAAGYEALVGELLARRPPEP
ncbi:MAG: Acylamidase [Burkholderiaceae bacterium]|nr:Acylamidase [Burkholderiaceae bacterium]